ncbi:MAG: hypothetical protein GY821_07845 [Gammaproteobacteria bacterium]|nr:hypothetical protein [Gammaproteobacteria bacterium]
MKLLTSVLLVSLLSLAGCAFSPEQVKLQPQVNVQKQNIGEGKQVAVRVIDARPHTDLGGRVSGLGPTAKISLANDLDKVVKDEVDSGLKNLGFQPVPYSAQAQRRLTVHITNLDYRSRAGFWTANISINSTLEASAVNGDSSYDHVYRGDSEHRVMVTPTSNSDFQNVNRALSASLDKMLNDQNLMIFLKRNG